MDFAIPRTATNSTETRAFGLSPITNYRQVVRVQFKYLIRDGVILGAPAAVGDVFSVDGATPLPCLYLGGAFGVPGIRNGTVQLDTDQKGFSYWMSFRAGSAGQTAYRTLLRRELPFVFFRFRFDAIDGNLKSRVSLDSSDTDDGSDGFDYSSLPTFFLYKRRFNGAQYYGELAPGFPKRENLMKFMLNSKKLLTGPHYPN